MIPCFEKNDCSLPRPQGAIVAHACLSKQNNNTHTPITVKHYLSPLLFFCFLQVSIQLSGQAFLRQYEHAGSDSIFLADIAPTDDGGFFALATVARTAMTDGVNASDGLVVRIGADGGLLWSREYDAGTFQNLNEIHATRDGGFILGGTTTTDYFDAYLAKADSDGNIEWTRYLGNDELQRGYELLQTADGGYLLAGHYLFLSTTQLYIAKLDETGAEQWARRYPLPGDPEQTGYSLVELEDQTVVVAGSTGQLLGATNAFVAKFNPGGAMLWARTYDYNGFSNFGVSVSALPNRELILLQRLTYSSDPFSNGSTGLIVSRLNVIGQEIWSQEAEMDNGFTSVDFNGFNLSYTSEPGKVMVTPEEDIVISCQGDLDDADEIRPQLFKLDSDGNPLWGRTFGEAGFLHMPAGGLFGDGLTITSDNSYGVIYQEITDRQSFSVAKIPPNGEGLCATTAMPEFTPISLTITPYIYSVVTFSGFQVENTTVVDRPFTSEPADDNSFMVDLGPDTLLCPGGTLTLDADLGPEFDYQWQDGSGLPTFGVLAPGEYSVTVSQGACFDRDTVVVADFTTTLDLGPDQSICAGATLELMPTAVVPGTYTWDDGTPGATLEVNTPGTYILTLSDLACGSLMDTVVVSPAADISIDISGATAVCAGEDISLTANSTTPGLSYSWIDADGNVLSDTETLTFNAVQSGSLIVFATDGCSITSENILYDVFMTEAVVLPDATSCGENNGVLTIAELIGLPPYTIEWLNSDNVVVGQGPEPLMGLAPGFYTLMVTDADGCSFTADYLVNGSTGLSLDVLVEDVSCLNPNGGSIMLSPSSGNAPFAYTLNGGALQEEGLFMGLAAGVYELEVTDALGCDTTLLLDVLELPAPEAAIVTSTTDLALGESTLLQVQTNVDSVDIALLSWQPTTGLSCTDCLNPVAQPEANTTYTVALTDVNGCTAFAEIRLTIDSEIELYIPNVFSPNNDGSNDRFIVFPGKGIAAVESVQIFDRWGGLMYEQAGNQGWDGRAGGEPAVQGVYLYQVVVQLFDGSTRVESGDIVLIR